jgi:hypothetical protein
MTYDVLKDYEDPDFMVHGDDDARTPLTLKVGESFIPAQFGYPAKRVEKLLIDGTLKLHIKESAKEAPKETPKAAKKKA